MFSTPKYDPASFEKYSLTENILKDLASPLHISPRQFHQTTPKKFQIKKVDFPDYKMTFFPRKSVKDSWDHKFHPMEFPKYKPVDARLNEIFGIPDHKIVLNLKAPIAEFDMKGVSPSDLMVMRYQNENGTDNKLSQILDQNGMPSSLDGYFDQMENRIKDKYSKVREIKQGSIEKVKNDLDNFKKDAFGNVQETNPKTKREIKRMENKIKFNKDQLDIINKTEQNFIHEQIIPHRERKERRKTKLLVNPPILQNVLTENPVEATNETNITPGFVKEKVDEIENRLEKYKEILMKSKKKQGYKKSLGNNDVDTESLFELLREKDVPFEKYDKKTTTNQMLKLLNSLDENIPMKKIETKPKSPAKRKTRSSKFNKIAEGED